MVGKGNKYNMNIFIKLFVVSLSVVLRIVVNEEDGEMMWPESVANIM